MKRLYILTVGKNTNNGGNPGLAMGEAERIKFLIKHFPDDGQLISAIGKRFMQTYLALGIMPVMFSPLFGTANYLNSENLIITADAGKISQEMYCDIPSQFVRQEFKRLADNTIVLCEIRVARILIEKVDSEIRIENGALYKLELQSSMIKSIEPFYID